METPPSEKLQESWQLPKKQGLYDPENEHEACGVGFIVAIDGKGSHKVSYIIFGLEMFFYIV